MSSVSELADASSAITNPSHPYDSDPQASTHSLAPSVEASPGHFRRKTSPIWLHCRIEEGRATPGAWVDPDGTRWWHCRPCFDKKKDKRYKYSGGSSTITNHLRKEHNIVISDKLEVTREMAKSRLGSIVAFLAGDGSNPTKKRKVTTEEDALDQGTLRELYCRYTVACSLPFSHVEQEPFRDLIRYILPAADDLLPRSADTIKNDLQRGYDVKKEPVKRALQNAVSSIHIVPTIGRHQIAWA
ncbi:hypothetical protein JDV02_003083 [Purpureocillium takamizusanense]|uniref:BED-type domain-containing protein n=1 Tax=Purpureocillium takamizusanense TaxID=2060973 RepID=A0A9Q8QD03_9HYPO|nr:uncharacterized protein JDV02_003083 [Purpureocillium takamizusanense]UNI16666.1 hypothetical protein JDV02_003083 [Purpureocillium takamizusanense]